MVSKPKKLLFVILLFLAVSAVALSGPPDGVDANIYKELEAIEDSLSEIEKGLFLKGELLALDSLGKLSLELFDTSGLPSFSEIIIDETGIIKVMTDTGFIVISPDNIKSIIPSTSPGFSGLGRREITRWGKNIVIDEGELVIADIIVISGDVTVNGTVEGDVLVIGGDIYVNSTGYVKGDAIAVGGRLKQEEGAKITGSHVAVKMPFLILPRGSVYQSIEGVLLIIMIIALFLSALSISLFPKPISRLTDKLSEQPIKSFIFGYIFYVGLFFVWLLLMVSVIGIPLALLGEPVAFAILIIFAYTAINLVLGKMLFGEKIPFKSFWLGSLVTTGPPFLLLFLGYLTNSLALFVINMAMLGIMAFIILPFGLGAASLARFGLPPRAKKANDDPEQKIAVPTNSA